MQLLHSFYTFNTVLAKAFDGPRLQGLNPTAPLLWDLVNRSLSDVDYSTVHHSLVLAQSTIRPFEVSYEGGYP